MRIGNTSTLTSVSLVCVGLLSGCVQFVSVKDIANDKPGYLASHFSVESLPSGVREKFPASGAHVLPFKVLTISGSESGNVGATAVRLDFKSTLINANDTGMIQQVSEASNNGVPSSATFSLSYLNLYSLKQETALYSQTVALIPFVAHDIDNNQFVFDAPKEDSTYTTRFSFGTAAQIINFRSVVTTCHTGRYYPASRVNAALTGKAIDLDCEDTKDGIIQSKARHTYLTEYGIGLNRSLATATAKFEWTYSEFEKDGEKAAMPLGKPAASKSI